MTQGRNGRGVRGRRNITLERTIGHAVREARLRAGLSRDDLAARMGLRPAQLRRLENATVIIRIDHLAAAARCLDVPVSAFYGPYAPLSADEASNAPPHPMPPQLYDTEETRALLEAYRTSPPDVRQSFLALLRSLAEP
ncbi:helix-turn-helix transcriptional regulator [Roseospira marina]|uniref:Helix-turn-helix transcriptional regulator n=1 Tax=Roseospira marina TaxID=140057 RepID=A0A5M6IDZ5_9PROT|nr:helix-turn-helix transcriptional regulator [Roseospira marina]KAA5606511.1 helix-turn-helix transcriptional regulator [Roseospira marina]MBB4314066.1 transcriptional regulator with XRE-family HTH domain [Roseospira marina]MBB5087227.1 transcriptional regulator with XRE-family HTH domain [Roseospira marina]